ncbi:MAG: tetratricopeptide repeat protein [Cyanobacteria bacterium SZAS LIN-2]|nr:tetratricopeptide repeat protein [Cyanobacteria bacterium SZAS LIN-2]
MIRPAILPFLAISLLISANAALAVEPWSAEPINVTGSPTIKGGATAAEIPVEDTSKPPAYQDPSVENALDTGDYARAQSLVSDKLKAYSGGRGKIGEAYLRTALVESLIWQGLLKDAATELKKQKKALSDLSASGGSDYTADDFKELSARALDDESWLQENQGDISSAAATIDSALVLLKQLHGADRDTWRLVSCLSHSAAIKASAGDYDAARKILEDALVQAGGSHSISPLNVADIQESLGSVYYKLGKQDQSADHYDQAIRIKNGTGALGRRYAPGPYWLSPDYRYKEGSPWSAKNFQNGLEHKRIDVGPVSVEAAVARDKNAGKQTVQVFITVINKSNQTVEFMGRKPLFVILTPKASVAQMIDPGNLAAAVQKKGEGKAKWIRFWGEGATTTCTSHYMGNNMPYYGYGGYPPMYGGSYPMISRGSSSAIMTTQVPDPIAEAAAFERAQKVQAAAQAKAEDIRSKSLGPSDLPPGQAINGSLFFDAYGMTKSSSCLLRIPVGDSQFEFRFDNIPDGQ